MKFIPRSDKWPKQNNRKKVTWGWLYIYFIIAVLKEKVTISKSRSLSLSVARRYGFTFIALFSPSEVYTYRLISQKGVAVV